MYETIHNINNSVGHSAWQIVILTIIISIVFLTVLYFIWKRYSNKKINSFTIESEKYQVTEETHPKKVPVKIHYISDPESELIKRALEQLKERSDSDDNSLKKAIKETIVGKTIKTEPVYKPISRIVTIKTELENKNKPLADAASETENDVKETLYVKYKCTLEENTVTYPILRLPKYGSVIRSHRIGSSKRRGFKEADLQRAIESYFSDAFAILGNARLNTGKNTRPFEPDIAMISKVSTKNIRIDVEIDEPYAGISRQATHCKGDDFQRDTYFIDRGWIVVRFSEYQAHKQEKLCLLYLAKLIKSIDPDFVVPESLKAYQAVEDEPVWDILQAQKWEKEKYREKYLGHEFLLLPEERETLERDLNAQEVEEENQVEPTPIGESESIIGIGYNKKNAHARDKRIRFYPEPHVYTVDNKSLPSVSTIVSRFFPVFDTKYWSEHKAFSMGMTAEEVALSWKINGENAAISGTLLHKQIENYFLGLDYDEPKELEYFKNFVKDHQTLKPYRTEWRVFDEIHGFAGTIDFITSNGNGFDIFDWKRSKKVLDSGCRPITENPFQSGIGPLSHIPDTSFNRYCIQQNLYRFILEANYQISIKSMYIVVLHPLLVNYFKLRIPEMPFEVQNILKTLY